MTLRASGCTMSGGVSRGDLRPSKPKDPRLSNRVTANPTSDLIQVSSTPAPCQQETCSDLLSAEWALAIAAPGPDRFPLTLGGEWNEGGKIKCRVFRDASRRKIFDSSCDAYAASPLSTSNTSFSRSWHRCKGVRWFSRV